MIALMLSFVLATSPVPAFSPAEMASIEQSFHQYAYQKGAHGGALVITNGTQTVISTYGKRNDKDPYLATTPQRVASVSKTITATAMMTLIQAGKANLDDKVLPILNKDREKPIVPQQPTMEQMTIRHLLQHTAGFTGDAGLLWSQLNVSSRFKTKLPIPAVDLVDLAFTSQGLATNPGGAYQYSNIGYLVLARVIEKVSGKPYGVYVRSAVLAPAGISADEAYVGHSKNLKDNESQYWDLANRMGVSLYPEDNRKKVPFPYGGGYSLETMDGYGGWCMSARALIQFQLALPKILSKEMQAVVTQRPAHARGQSYTGLGFMVIPESLGGFTIEHGGSLEGLNACIMYRANGQVIAVTFNTGGMPNDNMWSSVYAHQVLVPMLNQMGNN
jgi:N-acyl-D-amino-acid deacylase